jgi:putative Ca2+/H+ antiporter (TMEM165/GDT1 family)
MPAFASTGSPGPELQMNLGSFDAALVSARTVALAEIGDKTQLLALLLAARFRKPVPIILGILAATLLNHALAGWVGTLVAHSLTPQVLRWVVAVSFIAIALWTLKPDTLDEDTPVSTHGALVATVIAFFLAEMGDKTQVATVLLAARYSPLWQVVLGTTIGMLLANVPVVLLGSRFAQRLPLRAARIAAAVLVQALGLWALKGAL